MTHRTILIALAAVVALAATATALWAKGSDGGSKPELRPLTAGTLTPEDTVRPASGEPVLDIGGPAAGRTVELDLATLEQLPQVELTVHEPFVKRDITFTGVRVSDALALAHPRPEARSGYFVALDDYHLSLELPALAEDRAVIATRADGRRIRIDDGGPIRVVFPDGGSLAEITDNWIWSLRSVELRG